MFTVLHEGKPVFFGEVLFLMIAIIGEKRTKIGVTSNSGMR